MAMPNSLMLLKEDDDKRECTSCRKKRLEKEEANCLKNHCKKQGKHYEHIKADKMM